MQPKPLLILVAIWFALTGPLAFAQCEWVQMTSTWAGCLANLPTNGALVFGHSAKS